MHDAHEWRNSFLELIQAMNECPVCLDEKRLNIYKCGHGLCNTCYHHLINLSCPVCRADLPQRTGRTQFEYPNLIHCFVELTPIDCYFSTNGKWGYDWVRMDRLNRYVLSSQYKDRLGRYLLQRKNERLDNEWIVFTMFTMDA